MDFHLPKGLHDILVEDEHPSSVNHPQPAPVPAAPVPVAPSAPAPVVSPSDAADHQSDAYQKVLAKTNYSQVPVFQTLKQYLEPLADMAMDDKTKFSIAVKQAQAREGLDVSALLKCFDDALTTLQTTAETFSNAVAARVQKEVTARNQQAADLQSQAHQLTEDAFAAQQKIDQSKHYFDIAVQTRTTEINQEKTKYASLLA